MDKPKREAFAEILPGWVVICRMDRIGEPASLDTAQEAIDGWFSVLSDEFEGTILGGMYDAERNILYWAFRDEAAAQACTLNFNKAEEVYHVYRKK